MSAHLDKRPIAAIVHSGGRWIPPRKVIITDLHDVTSEYLVRYVIFRTPWFGVQVHRINRPDHDRHLHNHPRVFLSLVLRGGYTEVTDRVGQHHWRTGSIHRMSLDKFHSIRQLLRAPTWTLVIVGPARQQWGFATEDGFIQADNYPAYLIHGQEVSDDE